MSFFLRDDFGGDDLGDDFGGDDLGDDFGGDDLGDDERFGGGALRQYAPALPLTLL